MVPLPIKLLFAGVDEGEMGEELVRWTVTGGIL